VNEKGGSAHESKSLASDLAGLAMGHSNDLRVG
jgi:hypothetical protein